jgi:hypothetical protein
LLRINDFQVSKIPTVLSLRASNQGAGGSSPSGRAKKIKNLRAIAEAQFSERSENVAFFATFAPRGASAMSLVNGG